MKNQLARSQHCLAGSFGWMLTATVRAQIGCRWRARAHTSQSGGGEREAKKATRKGELVRGETSVCMIKLVPSLFGFNSSGSSSDLDGAIMISS